MLVSFLTYRIGETAANFGGPVGYGLANIVVQVLVIVAVVFYHPRTRVPKITINRRSIAA